MRRRLHLIAGVLLAMFLVQCGDDKITNDDPINLDTFAITIGGEDDEVAHAMVATIDGVVMVGETTSASISGLVVNNSGRMMRMV